MAGTQVSRDGFLPWLRFNCSEISETWHVLYVPKKKSVRILKYLKYASLAFFACKQHWWDCDLQDYLKNNESQASFQLH